MMIVRVLAAFGILAGALAVAGCMGIPLNFTAGSGKTVTTDFDFQDFDAVETSNAFTIAIQQGQTYAVRVTVDDNIQDKLIVEKRGNTLVIALRTGAYTTLTLHAEITMPELTSLKLSGASSAALAGFSGAQNFEGVLSGASTITGDISATSTRLDLLGASRVTLRGQGESLDAKVSGASKLNLGDLVVQTATVNLSGASSALINASQAVDATASGASTVEYIGNPAKVRESSSGASSVKQR